MGTDETVQETETIVAFLDDHCVCEIHAPQVTISRSGHTTSRVDTIFRLGSRMFLATCRLMIWLLSKWDSIGGMLGMMSSNPPRGHGVLKGVRGGIMVIGSSRMGEGVHTVC
jgi:hypothetical protein